MIGYLDILLQTLQPNIIYDSWFKITPARDVPKGGSIHLMIQLVLMISPPFQGPKVQYLPFLLHLKVVEAKDVPKK